MLYLETTRGNLGNLLPVGEADEEPVICFHLLTNAQTRGRCKKKQVLFTSKDFQMIWPS